MKILEVVIAASILLIGLVALFITTVSESSDNLKTQGYDAFDHLYDTGKIRELSRTEDPDALRKELDGLLDYNFKAIFCRDVCNNNGVPDDRDVVIVDYYVSGFPDGNDLRPVQKKLRLYLWQ